MSNDHTHDDHGHDHAGMGEGDAEPGYYPTRLRAIEALFIENGVFTLDDVERAIEETYVRSSADGARVVARAWVDPDFKARLLNDAISAVAELGYEIPDNMPRLTVVENTDTVHNLVVCTLCSCYPRALLGRPPEWYKSLTYRSQAVVDPRRVMREFGTNVGDDVEVRVQDSSADMRYLILPRRPEGSEHMSEEELANLVTRDSMLGVTHALSPEPSPSL